MVVNLLADSEVISVEHMRAALLEKLTDLQADFKGGDLDKLETYCDGGRRVSENTATKCIVSWLRPHLQALDVSDAIEHQMKNAKRCDFTAVKMLGGRRRLLVTEVKGQWNPNSSQRPRLSSMIDTQSTRMPIIKEFIWCYGFAAARRLLAARTQALHLRKGSRPKSRPLFQIIFGALLMFSYSTYRSDL